jgi:hypothetical protein
MIKERKINLSRFAFVFVNLADGMLSINRNHGIATRNVQLDIENIHALKVYFYFSAFSWFVPFSSAISVFIHLRLNQWARFFPTFVLFFFASFLSDRMKELK